MPVPEVLSEDLGSKEPMTGPGLTLAEASFPSGAVSVLPEALYSRPLCGQSLRTCLAQQPARNQLSATDM